MKSQPDGGIKKSECKQRRHENDKSTCSVPSNIFDEADPIMNAKARMIDESERKSATGLNPI